MGQAALLCRFGVERRVPADPLLRAFDRFDDLLDIRAHLRPNYNETGCPSIDPALIDQDLDYRRLRGSGPHTALAGSVTASCYAGSSNRPSSCIWAMAARCSRMMEPNKRIDRSV